MKDSDMVQEIKKDLIKKLQDAYSFCGCAEGDNMIMLNSGNENIIINIKWEDED